MSRKVSRVGDVVVWVPKQKRYTDEMLKRGKQWCVWYDNYVPRTTICETGEHKRSLTGLIIAECIISETEIILWSDGIISYEDFESPLTVIARRVKVTPTS